MFARLSSRRREFRELATARSDIGPIPLAGSLIATYIGPGLSIGLIGQVYQYGWPYAFVTCSYVVQLFAVAWFIGPRIKSSYSRAQSLGDILVASVPSPSSYLPKTIGSFSVMIMVGVCAIMIRISGHLLHNIFPMPPFIASLDVCLCVAAYTTLGGLRFAIWTDVTQLIVYFALTLVIVALAFLAPIGLSQLNDPPTHVLSNSELVGLAIAFACGDMLQPPFVQRILAARSIKSVRVAFFATAACLISWFMIMGALGHRARSLGIREGMPDDVFFDIASNVLPSIGSKTASVIVLLIILSSFTSVLNAAATVFTQDVVGSSWDIRRSPRSAMFQQGATLLLAISGFVLSQAFSSVMFGILFLASVWGPAIVIPVVSLLYVRQKDHLAAISSMTAGGATSLVWHITPYTDNFPPIAAGLLVSAVAFLSVHAFRSRDGFASVTSKFHRPTGGLK